ncbi:MAG: DUF6776 family protein [Gammaproteobacteria bacterium]
MKLVIRQHRPLRRVLIGCGIALATLLLAGLVLDIGGWRDYARAVVARGDGDTGGAELERLREENGALRFQIARLERSEEIARTARSDSQAQFVQLQAEVAGLRREIEFYRDVVGAADTAAGPRVKGVQLKPLADVGRFGFRVILAHIDVNDREAEGSVRLAVKGEIKGQAKSLGTEVIEAGSASLNFKFKHFRMVEGVLRLPEGFVPRQITVAVQGRMPAASSSSETYDWAAVLN